MPQFESLTNESEFVSDHYLTSDETKQTFLAQVRTRRREWNDDRKAGLETPLSRFSAARVQLLTELSELSGQLVQSTEEGTTGLELGATAGLQETYRRVLDVLGFKGPLSALHAERGNDELVLTDVWHQPRPGAEHPAVVILPAEPSETLEDAIGNAKPLAPVCLGEKQQTEWSMGKTVSELFQTEEAPSYVVIVAGRFIILAERARWAEGRYLAIDIQLVAERNETKQGGEIDYFLTIFSSASLTPAPDGTFWWDTVLEESVSHAVAVSEDLREGVRRSIEIIANDVLDRHRAQGLGIEHLDGNVLARQAMRYLYRILFLLYAEASPEMKVLPVGVEEYDAGYGLDRLRELISHDLTGAREEQGTHFYDSLALLFDLVNGSHPIHGDGNGVRPAQVGEDGLVFQPLRADLFEPEATSLIDRVKLSNRALHGVLTRLLLSSEQAGIQRGYVSYATLGVNQLGAVYEGLMSYTGFIAEEPLHEVAPGGDARKGSWVVSVDRSGDISPEDFVTVTDPDTGQTRPVLHPTGSFVYRLAGRERQQSASYYTPEVLTRFVVAQALEELLDQPDEQGNPQRTSAAEILQLSVCEPALGSGAFAIEAVRQLADEYLTRREEELDERIPAEQRPAELQKVKAHIALHQVYGVDLNDTAVELAEISLWLDTMSTDLQAPWFGLRLKQGNSLLGAKRASYTRNQAKNKDHLKVAPTEHPLTSMAEAMLADRHDNTLLGRIHHFLLPAEGWGAAASVKEVKDLAGDNQQALRAWQRQITKQPTNEQLDALLRLSHRVETLWPMALRRLQVAEVEAQRHIDYFGKAIDQDADTTAAVSREDIEHKLQDPNGIYQRLKLVMDLWSALWFWPVVPDGLPQPTPPSMEAWLDALQMILGAGQTMAQDRKQAPGQGDLLGAATWEDLNDAETIEQAATNMRPINELLKAHPWVQTARGITAEQNFFHWELEFGTIFSRGGFDLQVGNPPWVRPRLDVESILAEFDPWWQLAHKPTQAQKDRRRELTLSRLDTHGIFVDNVLVNPILSKWLGASTEYTALSGSQPDLYRAFMVRTWLSARRDGVIGLIHPISHFSEAKARNLRRATYVRIRRHWHFTNALRLYDVAAVLQYGVHVYGAPKIEPTFIMASSLYHPDTATSSLIHDGSGELPGLRDEKHNWDTRPHKNRIQHININVLSMWHSLLESPEIPILETRMIFLPNTANATVLSKMANQQRIRDLKLQSSHGWDESIDRRKGYFEIGSAKPTKWRDVILQGPHFYVATPLAKEPRTTMRSKADYDDIDFEALSRDFIPRTSYQPNYKLDFDEKFTHWETTTGKQSARNFFRIGWRKMVNATNERTLIPTVIPPGTTHIDGIVSSGPYDDAKQLLLHLGVLSSLPYDFMVRSTGITNVRLQVVNQLPGVENISHEIGELIVTISAKLIAMTEAFAPLWESATGTPWSPGVWERTAQGRRRLAIYLDVLAAMSLGITLSELITLYQTQFPVLRNYETNNHFDQNGRKLPIEVLSLYQKHGERIALEDRTWSHPQSGVEYTFDFPFRTLDREQDYRDAWAKFEKELGVVDNS